MIVQGPLVLACAALVRELRAVSAVDGLDGAIEIDVLPAPLHNRPDRIVAAIEERLATEDPARPVLLGYADCGTGGHLDAFIESTDRPVTRLPGAHCYEFFAGSERFRALHDAEPGTFYLTDFLARHFDALVWSGLGIDRHPQLRDVLFAHYRRVVLLHQGDDHEVVDMARRAADLLDLDLAVERTGLAPFAGSLDHALRMVATA